jgi:hypothetical protein
MHGRLARVLLASACVAGYLAMAGSAQASTGQRLLHRYQPVTQLDPLEQFAPSTIDAFVRDSTLEVNGAGGWTTLDANPSPNGLPHRIAAGCTTLADCYRLNQQPCSPADGVAAIACYRDTEQAGGTTNAIYARIAYRPHRLILQYWYFYYDDVYSYDYPPDPLFWQAHEGDWEVVNVVLNRRTHRPLAAAYSQHCTGERRAWADVPRMGTHPVDHVAIGSHANLFAQGDHTIASACIPAQALAILAANGLPAPVDRSGNGSLYGPASIAGATAQPVERIGRRVTPWATFPGTWGEDQYFHAPPPINTVPFGTSPQSPAVTAMWKRPLQVINAWPVT